MSNSTYIPQKDQLSTTGVVPGLYTNSNVTVNATGQITVITSGTGSTGGLPVGGTAGQVLSKIDATDYNVQWSTLGTGGNMNTSVYDPAVIAQQIVGLTATQTLTNKNLASGTNIFPVFNQSTTGTAANITGILAFANGGTGATTQIGAINATNPHSTLGDISYHNGTNVVRLAGNVTVARQFLLQTGTGSVSSAPAWGAIIAGDIPTLNQNTTGNAATSTNAAQIAGITITGTPSTGQVPTATSATSATWQTPVGGTGGGTNHATFQISAYTVNSSLGQQAFYGLYVATATQTITKVQIYLPVVLTGSVIAATFYSASLAQLGGTGTVTTTSTIGLYTITLASAVSLTVGTTYYFALLNQTNETVTRFAMDASANDVAVTSTVSATTALPTTMPAVGSRSAYAQVPYMLPLS